MYSNGIEKIIFMFKSIIREAFERAMMVTAFKWIIIHIKWIINKLYEYRFYIVIGLIILGILVILGLVIEWREKRKKNSF